MKLIRKGVDQLCVIGKRDVIICGTGVMKLGNKVNFKVTIDDRNKDLLN